MFIESAMCGYIDPNTSQHVFSLFGPILALVTTTGGLIVTGAVLVRQRIVSYFKKASWLKRLMTLSVVAVVLTVTAVLVGRLIRR